MVVHDNCRLGGDAGMDLLMHMAPKILYSTWHHMWKLAWPRNSIYIEMTRPFDVNLHVGVLASQPIRVVWHKPRRIQEYGTVRLVQCMLRID